jgi:hypothetical protein
MVCTGALGTGWAVHQTTHREQERVSTRPLLDVELAPYTAATRSPPSWAGSTARRPLGEGKSSSPLTWVHTAGYSHSLGCSRPWAKQVQQHKAMV